MFFQKHAIKFSSEKFALALGLALSLRSNHARFSLRDGFLKNISSPDCSIIMRKKIIFQGEVQGIGFRYSVKMLAEKFNVFGWVENSNDGSVKLVAEGVEENIEKLINNLKDYFQDNIENIEESVEKDEGLIDFKIK